MAACSAHEALAVAFLAALEDVGGEAPATILAWVVKHYGRMNVFLMLEWLQTNELVKMVEYQSRPLEPWVLTAKGRTFLGEKRRTMGPGKPEKSSVVEGVAFVDAMNAYFTLELLDRRHGGEGAVTG